MTPCSDLEHIIMKGAFRILNNVRRKYAFAAVPLVAVGLSVGVAYSEADKTIPRTLKEGKEGKDVHADPSRGTLPVQKYELSDGFESYRPDPTVWTRVDETVMESPSFKPFIRNNVVHDTLVGQGMLEKYEIYQKVVHSNPDAPVHEVMCLVHCGKSLNGHPGVVHGGIVVSQICT